MILDLEMNRTGTGRSALWVIPDDAFSSFMSKIEALLPEMKERDVMKTLFVLKGEAEAGWGSGTCEVFEIDGGKVFRLVKVQQIGWRSKTGTSASESFLLDGVSEVVSRNFGMCRFFPSSLTKIATWRASPESLPYQVKEALMFDRSERERIALESKLPAGMPARCVESP